MSAKATTVEQRCEAIRGALSAWMATLTDAETLARLGMDALRLGFCPPLNAKNEIIQAGARWISKLPPHEGDYRQNIIVNMAKLMLLNRTKKQKADLVPIVFGQFKNRMDPTITASEAALVLNISRAKFFRLRKFHPKLSYLLPVGKKPRYRVADVLNMAWAMEQTERPKSKARR